MNVEALQRFRKHPVVGLAVAAVCATLAFGGSAQLRAQGDTPNGVPDLFGELGTTYNVNDLNLWQKIRLTAAFATSSPSLEKTRVVDFVSLAGRDVYDLDIFEESFPGNSVGAVLVGGDTAVYWNFNEITTEECGKACSVAKLMEAVESNLGDSAVELGVVLSNSEAASEFTNISDGGARSIVLRP